MQELERNTNQTELNTIATYYFDGQGKALRPMVAILMARAVNYHVYGENRLVYNNKMVSLRICIFTKTGYSISNKNIEGQL